MYGNTEGECFSFFLSFSKRRGIKERFGGLKQATNGKTRRNIFGSDNMMTK